MIAFFVKRTIDIDHLAPVIYKYAQRGNACIVICMTPHLDISKDFRLNFLVEECHIRVEYLYNLLKHPYRYVIWGWIICNNYLRRGVEDIQGTDFLSFLNKAFAKILRGFYRFGYAYLFKAIVKHIFDKKWAEQFIKTYRVSAVVFDSAMHHRLYNFSEIRRAANEFKIPVIYLPHGLPLTKLKNKFGKKVYGLMMDSKPDFIGVPHEIYAQEHIEHGVPPQKMQVLGSARFCDEWRKVLKRITPKDRLPTVPREMLKVVYMDRNPGRHGKNMAIARETIRRLSQLDFIKLIVKPHPRSNRSQFEGITKDITVMSNVNSQNLIFWSDVVIGTLSSIIVDVLIAKKDFIFLKYFMLDDDNFELPFFGHKVGWEIDSYDELKTILMNIKGNPNKKSYSSNSIELFLRQLIYKDTSKYNVLENYVTWLKNLENGFSTK